MPVAFQFCLAQPDRAAELARTSSFRTRTLLELVEHDVAAHSAPGGECAALSGSTRSKAVSLGRCNKTAGFTPEVNHLLRL